MKVFPFHAFSVGMPFSEDLLKQTFWTSTLSCYWSNDCVILIKVLNIMVSKSSYPSPFYIIPSLLLFPLFKKCATPLRKSTNLQLIDYSKLIIQMLTIQYTYIIGHKCLHFIFIQTLMSFWYQAFKNLMQYNLFKIKEMLIFAFSIIFLCIFTRQFSPSKISQSPLFMNSFLFLSSLIFLNNFLHLSP